MLIYVMLLVSSLKTAKKNQFMLSAFCVTNEYVGHVAGIAFCLYVKAFKRFVQFIGILELRTVFLAMEGFRHNKSGITITELSVSTHNYINSFVSTPEFIKYTFIKSTKIFSSCLDSGERRLPLFTKSSGFPWKYYSEL